VTTADTRGELIAAAEHLFAARGIDGPSLRELTRAAGQRNTGALQYLECLGILVSVVPP
jgi:AcrR family transcriptional regulator